MTGRKNSSRRQHEARGPPMGALNEAAAIEKPALRPRRGAWKYCKVASRVTEETYQWKYYL